MKGIINFVLKNKLAVWLLTIIITATGIYSGTQMKTESIPDITIPYLLVTDIYPGATAEQVMEEVSIPLEKAVEDLEDVKNVYSTSSSSVSSIQIEYNYGIDMAEKRRLLQDALDEVQLPEGSTEPMITAISMNMMPVVAVSISSSEEDIVELTSTVNDVILPKIEKIDGVASVAMTGQHIEEVQLKYNYERLEQLGLTQENVEQIIQASDMQVSLGLFEFEEGEQAVSVDGKFMTAEDLKELLIPVTTSETNPIPFVQLGDIADLELVGQVESVSRTNGEDAITIQVLKGQQANTVDVVNAVKDLMADEEERISGLTVDISLDQAEPIEKSISTMVEKALFGALIAVLIILLFLRDFKSTIISVISIPVSVFMSFLVLNYLGITMNIMTLGAVTVAIGRVIDDSIVVVENIYRRIHLKDEKLTGRALIRESTIEMFKPILSSTLVTVAVFAPMVLVGGMVGELFLPFALTMSLALIGSLIVAITIVPALSHTLFKKKIYGEKTEMKHKEQGKFTLSYKKFLDWTLNHKIATFLTVIVIFVGSLMLIPKIGFSFLGSEEDKMLYLTYTPETGELLEVTLENVAEVEEELLTYDDVDIVQLSVTDSQNQEAAMMGAAGGALMFVVFDPDMNDFPQARDEITDYLTEIGHTGEWKNQDFAAMMGGASNELSYTFNSEDLNSLNEAVAMVEEIMSNNDRLENVSYSTEDAYLEHVVKIDQAELLQYGLTTGQVVGMLGNFGSPEIITTVEKDGETLDVIVQPEEEITPAMSIEELLDIPVPNMAAPGTFVSLADIVTVEEDRAVNQLSRSNNQYYATVSGKILDQDISVVTSEVDKAIEALDLPKGVEIDTAGVAADMEETFSQLGLAMLAAIAIVYFILVVTFSEGIAPFAVLFSLPFAVIGSLVGLFITGQTISVTVMMGLLMLIGIVVTNAIVLVDRIIRMERSGMPLREAIIEAGGTRLRPILMTAIATMGALIPLAIEGGGGLVSRDLGITVIGGLASSTVLTLIIVPLVYEVLTKLFKKDRRKIQDN